MSAHLDSKGTFYELPFLERLGEEMPTDTVAFDVGAHIGNHTVYFAGVLGWRVIAFEPNPEAFEKLIANVESNGVSDLVTCFQVALTDHHRRVRLARTEPQDAGTVAVLASDSPADTYIDADAMTLDNYEHLAGEGPVFVKIDVEGHERSVIEGGKGFLDRIRPRVSSEVQSVSAFEELFETLDGRYCPSGLFNPTPTVLWVPCAEGEVRKFQLDLVRYGIQAAVNSNEARLADLPGRRSLAALQSAMDERPRDGAPTTETEERKDIGRLHNQMVAAHNVQRLAGKRLLAVVVGECRVPAAALSVIAKAVDVVEISPTDPRRISMRRYVRGHAIKEQVRTYPRGSDRLTAAQIVWFVDSVYGSLGSIDAAAVIGGESASDISDAVIDLLGVPYISLALDPVYRPDRMRTLIGSAGCFVRSYEQLSAWYTRQIIPAGVLDPEDPLELLSGISKALPPAHYPRKASEGAQHRLLLVSYYSPPTTTVSVQRLAYWKENLGKIASGVGVSLEVGWLTATSQSETEPGIMVIVDRGPLYLPEEECSRVKNLEDLGLDTVGASWSHYVRESVENLETSYDTVLISGNPFYYFDLAPFFQELWGSKVILDFRDPWARNERFKYTVEQRAKLIALEQELAQQADGVISVNEKCLELIAPHANVPKCVIANGFDESIVDTTPPREWKGGHANRTVLAYAGTVYRSLPLDNLLASLAPNRYRLLQFGRDYSKSQATRSSDVAHAHGIVSYQDLISGLKRADAGIIMTWGEAIASNTKLFDYLACDLDIIIVTRGIPRTGALHELTSDLEGVYWVQDDPNALKRFFDSYRPERRRRPERLRFSRREQARRLLEIVIDQRSAVSRAVSPHA